MKKFDQETIRKAIEQEPKPIKVIGFVKEDRERSEFVIYENGQYSKYCTDSEYVKSEITTNGTPMVELIYENGASKHLSAEKQLDPKVLKSLKNKLARVKFIIENSDKEFYIVGKDGKRVDLNNPAQSFQRIIVWAGLKTLASQLESQVGS